MEQPTTTCRCGRIRIGSEVTEARNLNPACPVHGLDTDYWSSPELVAQNARSVEMQRRAARARRIAANPEAASDSDKLRTLADRTDLEDERNGRSGSEAQDFLRELADRLNRLEVAEAVAGRLLDEWHPRPTGTWAKRGLGHNDPTTWEPMTPAEMAFVKTKQAGAR